ncbi:MAG: MoxR family ATPase [Kiritimatiellae bacterium]|nr:MoxR family ATPase [Kiritimatiellia bacterium]MBR1836487.1 MoxR family ATPase [Kiritimatiellia bacterium]
MNPADLEKQAETFDRIRREVSRVVVGQEKIVDRLLVALACQGHVLLEGVPGIAKTTLVRTLAKALGLGFSRVSFTPDLLPADLTGTMVYNPKDGTFSPKKGPVFANILLADEINRAPAKVQSALLEAMQERQVTLGDETLPLPSPFLVLATQNPIEQEGTYPLPEAQVDRFLFKCVVGTPSREDERRIMERFSKHRAPEAETVATPEQVAGLREALDAVYCDEKVGDYILDLVFATREPARHGMADLAPLIAMGASPRATLALNLAARANAMLHGRAYATPQDVKDVAPDVLRHRVALTYEAEAQEATPDAVVSRILAETPVP